MKRQFSFKKTVPASAMKAYFQIAERSLFYLKTVPASAMKPCFQIAGRSLFHTQKRKSRLITDQNNKQTNNILIKTQLLTNFLRLCRNLVE